ncbi:MAG: hypothetical protein SV186_04530 [Candidatus Nanohaloarchaea archaeon]|nr:hypothetical protein [Candidatus Nanohaloarchaea archaeon]
MDRSNPWLRGLGIVVLWVVIYILIGVLFDENLIGQAITGAAGGIAFSLAYIFFQRRQQNQA